jgi:hypothetical protein
VRRVAPKLGVTGGGANRRFGQAKFTLATPGCIWSNIAVNSVQEIESALRQLPPKERWEVAHWLLEDLQQDAVGSAEGGGSPPNGGQPLTHPDYSARRLRIFGSKVVPNMVLAGRTDERW